MSGVADNPSTRRRWWIAALAVVAVLVIAGVLVAVLSGGDDAEQPAADAPGAAAAAAQARSWELLSRPDLRPPEITVDVAPANPGGRVVLGSPRMEQRERDRATHQQGALMLDEQGRTRWWRPAPDGEPITELRVQRYQGEPVLTWWEGAASEFGIGRGQGVIVDQNYEEIATVQAGNDQTVDLHEFLLTPRGTALVTIYSRTRADLRPMGGKANAQVTQGLVQEIDVESGEVLFEWESIDEIPPTESIRPLPEEPDASFDYFHINSVNEDAAGDLIVSARHTSAIYKIDKETGKIVWRLGGKESDFDMAEGTEFGLQHDARFLGGGRVQIFDNGPDDERAPSSVKVLRLDEDRMRATLERRLVQPDGMYAESQGNAHPLDDGGVFVGWGSVGTFTRFGPDGEVLFDAHLPPQYDSYRGYLAEWTGRPTSRPALHVERDVQQARIAASWNGSTEVAAWQALAGPRPDALKPVGVPAAWDGIETRMVTSTPHPFIAVAALDADGRRLATSEPVRSPAQKPPER